MKGYLVELRIIKRHHDHRALTVFVPHADEAQPNLNAGSPEQAEEVARARLDSAAEPVGDKRRGQPSWYSVLKVESVVPVDV